MTVAVVVPTVDAMPTLRKGMELVQQDFNSFNIEVVYYKIPFEAAEQVPCLEKLPHEGIAERLFCRLRCRRSRGQ